ncbi:Rossmann-like and DUF2520 domain-containing protein [Chitinivorax sp. B]|uniref:Rossmann-like and DUF2520 domain-containing protein n=1 Tax=Chitinivorax sp. B TaxID=2502235 RepID=UPI0010F5D047|nr:Rossmann-like and DUF2520 domain-containing protein [Chitinivorax sp. B]
MTQPVLNIIGAGRAGRVIARLLLQHQLVTLGGVYNRTLASTQAAINWLGSGLAVEHIAQLPPADYWLIATPDDQLGNTASQLAHVARVRPGNTILHLSGSQASDRLSAPWVDNVKLASLHPLMSFAEPDSALARFPGTYCAIEGDAVAVSTLTQWITAVGGHPFTLLAAQKTLYHAAAVQGCNNLVALLETSLQCFERAGLPRAAAMTALLPLLQGTLSNMQQLGTVKGLTGPIARGDTTVIVAHLAVLDQQLPKVAAIYRLLGQVACDLSAKQGTASSGQLATIRALLDKPNTG